MTFVAPKHICRLVSEGSNSQIHYHYILWFGDNVYRKESISLTSQKGIFFIDAMNKAAALNSNYEFEARDNAAFGKFIIKIGGVSNDNAK